MMRAILIIAALLIAPALEAEDGWPRLYGHWTGSGRVSGMPSTVMLEFRPALGGRGHHLRFQNRMTMPSGQTWTFNAEALYLCGDGPCRGHWYDNRGAMLPVTAGAADRCVTVDWGDAATERGRTRYCVDDQGRMEVVDEVSDAEGRLKPFGRLHLVPGASH